MSIIDAHIHYGDDHPALLSLFDEFELKLLNICVAGGSGGQTWQAQAQRYRTLAAQYPQYFAWCTTFDLPRFDDPSYIDKVLAGLERDFEAGAVACKVWKNLGMEVRTPEGDFFMVDDELLDPIFDYVAQRDRTLLMHIAEPLACWQPLDENNPHFSYYHRNPQWHMYNRPEYPSHARLMAARDHVVEKHPDLKIVGAHLASLEYDVDEIAARQDRYPNLAVDTSARLQDLAIQDTDKVRRFFLAYADRILFGTDVVMRTAPSTMEEGQRSQTIDSLRETYRSHFAYFESDQEVTVRGRQTRGLALPQDVLDMLYRGNAERWYPLSNKD